MMKAFPLHASPKVLAWIVACACAGVSGAAHATDSLSRLQGLLQATPEGGWVNASIGSFSSAWPTGADRAIVANTSAPSAIVRAWSSYAWDSTRDQIVLWGGGHNNYAGNEIYLWSAETGQWGRGSLPSRIDAQGFVVDSAAPQSSHTYDNNLYLPVNDRFITFGGAAWPGGGVYQVKSSTGVVTRSGPWVWDPSLADPTKVGGTNGSGFNTAAAGGEMWMNRQGQWTGTEVSGFQSGAYIYGSTAYRTEGGADVVYMSVDPYQGGLPGLYRYTLGDLDAGGLDRWEKVGVAANTRTFGSAGTLDLSNNLFLRPSQRRAADGSLITELAVWDLDVATASKQAIDLAITLQLADTGESLLFREGMALEYSEATGDLYLFDGRGDGMVYLTRAAYDASGALLNTWEVQALSSSTALFPTLAHVNGTYGKAHYIDDLQAFMVLGEYDAQIGDANVWLYKPLAVAAVPEPAVLLLMLAGLAGVNAQVRRSRASRNKD